MLFRILIVATLLATISACNIRSQGSNSFGQLGDSINTSITTFSFGGDSWLKISSGGYRNCGIRGTDAELWCWGDGSAPFQISALTGWSEISVGPNHICGIREAALWCFGLNNNGQLGLGDTTFRSVLTLVSSGPGWKKVTVGDFHTCALVGSNNSMMCWGATDFGQTLRFPSMGTYTTTPGFIFSGDPIDGHGWNDVSAGFGHTCGISRSDGEIYCFGKALASSGFFEWEQVPKPSPSIEWKSVSVGDDYACATTKPLDSAAPFPSDALYCWGSNVTPTYVASPQTFFTVPQRVGTTVLGSGILHSSFSRVAAGHDELCAIFEGTSFSNLATPSITYTPTGELACIGDNTNIDATELNTTLPTTPGTVLIDVGIGYEHVTTMLAVP